MKVKIYHEGLLIVPETDFETDYLSKLCSHHERIQGYLRCGFTPADVIGIYIEKLKLDEIKEVSSSELRD